MNDQCCKVQSEGVSYYCQKQKEITKADRSLLCDQLGGPERLSKKEETVALANYLYCLEEFSVGTVIFIRICMALIAYFYRLSHSDIFMANKCNLFSADYKVATPRTTAIR